MKYIDEFRNRELAGGLIKKIKENSGRPVKLMEVCGTHTVNVFIWYQGATAEEHYSSFWTRLSSLRHSQ